MKLVEIVIFGFSMLAFTCVPWLAPKNTLFGVRTGVAFRSTEQAHKAITFFLHCLAVALMIGCAIIWYGPPAFGFIAALMLGVAVFLGAFVVLNRKLRAFAATPQATAELDLLVEDQMPQSKWLSLIPVSLLLGTAFTYTKTGAVSRSAFRCTGVPMDSQTVGRLALPEVFTAF